ncbi:MAG: MFS transporter [Bryobacteraceae bacterium]
MSVFWNLLKTNRNYRYTWMGQVVSEVGDHFNTIAVFSLALNMTGSGLAVSGVMLARAVPAILAAPVAGICLDNTDRKRVMIASDMVRFLVAVAFVFTVEHIRAPWILYVLSALLMFASPFFTSGRISILPKVASPEELHTANSLTQTTNWMALTVGTALGGITVSKLGYEWAFVFNAVSFLFSAWCISRLKSKDGHFRAVKTATGPRVVRPWHDYVSGLRYMKASPLILGIGLIHVGWATGGGAAQILFTLFGETVFHRGPAGIGIIWSFAGVGLLIGGVIGHRIGRLASFNGYKRTIAICYAIHGLAYVIFSQAPEFWQALVFITISRAGVAVSSVMNFSQLLRHVADEYRGRVFSTIESMQWSTMMLSMMAAGIASQSYSPRTIGAVAGILSSTTAIFWTWAHLTGRLPEPKVIVPEVVEPEVALHGEGDA